MHRIVLSFFALLALAGVAASAAATAGRAPEPAASPTPTAEQARFFETNVRPLLVERCQKCHGAVDPKGSLRLDSRAALLRGGSRGAAVAPGQPDGSRLLQAIRHQPGAPAMPPGEQLTDVEIAALEAWVKAGAPWPEEALGVGRSAFGGTSPNAERRTPNAAHWAFRPVRMPAVPRVRDAAWVRTPVDAFILAKLEAKGLKPAPPADRRTLIRRATFDLTGLPPTPAEVDAFLADRSPDAWEKVVDRLLASPAYGERWGRHWLDLARYADSNGMDENVHYGNAWRYRDYVVRSFNEDKPYDRFVIEQLAGDLLAGENGRVGEWESGGSGSAVSHSSTQDPLIATGFLSIGPKVISEVDDRKMEMDTIDEQIDTTGRVFMGMTLGCARCHDHKFDPVTTQDYYGLAGIFKSTRTMVVMKKPRMWHEHSLAGEADRARQAAYEKEVAARKEAIARIVGDGTARLRAGLAEGETLPKNVETTFPDETKAELKWLRDQLAALEKDPPEMPGAMGVTEGTVADVPVHIRGSFLALGPVVHRGVPACMAGPHPPAFDAQHSGRLELARWLASPEHPLTARVMVNRVWRWHFGQGLVRSTDNFGLLGERPSHSELLDWIASSFANGRMGKWGNGRMGEKAPPGSIADSPIPPFPRSPTLPAAWRLKPLHRLLMLSSAYRMSGAYDARAATADPEARLRWRFGARRLEAEEIRDALLAVSGRLDRTMGGTLLAMKNREYFFDHTSRDNTTYESRRRSLYLPVVRNHLYDGFQLFDFGDASVPTGDRPTTTVAPQALFMLNSDLVLDASASLATSLLAEPGLDDAGRLRALALRAFGRRASARETARDLALLAQLEAAQPPATEPAVRRRDAWTWLCQTKLAANEFVTVQ